MEECGQYEDVNYAENRSRGLYGRSPFQISHTQIDTESSPHSLSLGSVLLYSRAVAECIFLRSVTFEMPRDAAKFGIYFFLAREFTPRTFVIQRASLFARSRVLERTGVLGYTFSERYVLCWDGLFEFNFVSRLGSLLFLLFRLAAF